MKIGDPNYTDHDQHTHAGQAHFADPLIGATCSLCQHHVTREYLRMNRRYCEKARQLAGKWLPQVPGNAIACKYFSRRP
jgi:hypothetical protein